MNAPASSIAQETISDVLARFAASLTADAIPAAVRERAKYLILDAVGLAYASHGYRWEGVSLDALRSFGGGNACVIGHGRILGLRDAVLMNGILVHGLDYDDTHSRGVIHATASVFPTVLGAAEHAAASGADLLTAYVAGMEIATRIGMVAQGGFHQVGFHPTGLAGVFGCTVAAGWLHRLDASRLAMAQGIALSMGSGSLEFLEDGAWTKRMHPGWAGAAGIMAATLAAHGYIGPRRAYEGRFGLYASHLGERMAQADLGLATEALGERWQIEEVAVKPMPACHFTHAPADAAIALSREFSGSAAQKLAAIRRLRVLVPEQVVSTVCEPVANKRRPANGYDAQFSIPYIVATGLLKGRFTLDELDDAALADPDVLALAAKVDYEIDPASTFPRHYTGEVVVEMADGRVLRHREAVNRGNTDRPLTNEDIAAKYRENATRTLDAGRAQRVADAVLGLDRADARTLADLLAEPV
ncbi:MmgE/PrpD family protein [Cupriavidus sp.]|uniref:MmgE/PrpD family protein n=1 Tax=Cupriavidus sp. TaxID=1873897 RepID=UPI003D0C85E8